MRYTVILEEALTAPIKNIRKLRAGIVLIYEGLAVCKKALAFTKEMIKKDRDIVQVTEYRKLKKELILIIKNAKSLIKRTQIIIDEDDSGE